MDIGNRIKERRTQLGLTAEDLAAEVGKSRATIYRYENGDIENMPTTVLEPLADALYTTAAYLMGWTDDPHDWERIGNDEGIHPPKDFDGSYEDYIKFKMCEQQDALNENYYGTHIDESIDKPTKKEAPKIIQYYDQLNTTGKEAATEQVRLLTLDEKYTLPDNVASVIQEPEPDYLILKAAHNDAPIDDEELEKMNRDAELLKRLQNKRK